MQPFRPHYVSQWSEANLYFVDEKFTQEDDSGLIILEHPVSNRDYLLHEDFPELGLDMMNLQKEVLDFILLEDVLQTDGDIDGNRKDYIQTEEYVTYVITAAATFIIDGVEQASLTIERGVTVRFITSSSTVATHPFRLSTTSNGTHAGGVVLADAGYAHSSAVHGNPGAYVEYTLTGSTPDTIYYFCTAHSGMGGSVTVINNTGTSRSLLETSKPPAESYGVDFTPHQAWTVLPAYQYSRILTRMKGTVTIADGATAMTGSGSEFTSQLRVGDEFQTANENIISEETGGGILLESDERIEAEEIRIFHVQTEDLAADLLGTQIRNFRWLITTEDTTVAAHGTHAGVIGTYGTGDPDAESFSIVTSQTNQSLIVGLDAEVGTIDLETPEWEHINMLFEDMSKMTVVDPQAFMVKTITNDNSLEVTRKCMPGGVSDSVYQL
jgi:plastocyanin